MFGIVSAILFGVAFVLNGTGEHGSSSWFSPTSFMLAGLLCLALHVVGVGTGWTINRR